MDIVILTDNDKVIATVALSFDGEATYNEIMKEAG